MRTSRGGESEMRGRLFWALIGAIALVGAGAAVPSAADAASGGTRKYVVVFKDSVAQPGAEVTAHGRKFGFRAQFVFEHTLKGYAASLSPAAAAAVETDPDVAYLAPDVPMRATSCFGVDLTQQQCVPIWGDRIGTPASTTGSGNGSGVVNINVAVVDTGIDPTHPDLNVTGGVNCSNGKHFNDADGHGTLVAGIIGAKDNGIGIAGVAPGANLFAVRSLNNKGAGSTSSVLCGVDWITATRLDADPSNDIAVANMSLGTVAGPNTSQDDGNCGRTRKDALHQAICRSVAAGVTYVVSAGNATVDIDRAAPAAYDEVLTATALSDSDGQPGGLGGPPCLSGAGDDVPAFFSNYASRATDLGHTIAAPGVCTTGTAMLALCATPEVPQPSQCYAQNSGTSFASPVIAGTAALCIATGPCAGLTPAQIIAKLVSDAQTYNTQHPDYGFVGDPLEPIPGKYYGYLINAASY